MDHVPGRERRGGRRRRFWRARVGATARATTRPRQPSKGKRWRHLAPPIEKTALPLRVGRRQSVSGPIASFMASATENVPMFWSGVWHPRQITRIDPTRGPPMLVLRHHVRHRRPMAGLAPHVGELRRRRLEVLGPARHQETGHVTPHAAGLSFVTLGLEGGHRMRVIGRPPLRRFRRVTSLAQRRAAVRPSLRHTGDDRPPFPSRSRSPRTSPRCDRRCRPARGGARLSARGPRGWWRPGNLRSEAACAWAPGRRRGRPPCPQRPPRRLAAMLLGPHARGRRGQSVAAATIARARASPPAT